ncbi:protein GOLVEN 6 [Spinacia oleracea]|uniref:Protein GOLVEN 6 n=1 Tax=Spinacia oleracea TaxID=3562 RepID=A0A9R0IG11_SPIOL|nr:protein GOLVEN 6-like [Spinacia oleracea]
MEKFVFKLAIFLCVFYTLLLQPSTSFQLNVGHPRKLKAVVGKVTETDKHSESQMKAKEEIKGELQKKNVNMVQITGERWREWEENHDASDLFTMDYRRVRRRRPIHNKSLHP